MRWFVILFGFALSTGCEKIPSAGRGKTPVTPAAPAKPAPSRAAPAKKPAEPSPTPEPKGKPLSRDEAFAAAWDAAWDLSKQLDAAEPAASVKAMQLLTADESREAEIEMKLFSPEGAGRLIGLGFSAFVARRSRAEAKTDPDFRAVADAFWRPGDGPARILDAAGNWGRVHVFDRHGVAEAVRRGLRAAEMPATIRNDVLLLGGRDWLAR